MSKSMATSPNYNLIKTGLDPNTRRTFDATGYIRNGVNDNKPRTFCVHVLGYKKMGTPNETQPNERALCWQLAGPGTVPQWRCYKVTDLVGLAVNNMVGWQMGTEYSKHQNCVKNEKFQVPYPP
jgi:hypothetical protein